MTRSPDKMDIFVADGGGNIQTAAWQPGNSAFRGWWPVANGKTMPRAMIHGISRSRQTRYLCDWRRRRYEHCSVAGGTDCLERLAAGGRWEGLAGIAGDRCLAIA